MADLLALVCGVLLWVCYFPIGILGQVWYLIVSVPDLCILTYFYSDSWAPMPSLGENVEPDALKEWKINIFKIIDTRISFYSRNTHPLSP